MELKKCEYPSVHVHKVSDGKGKGIDPNHEDTQTCCLFQLYCFIPGISRNDWRTTIKGLDDNLVLENILADLKKECQCDGKIVRDEKFGRMIQLEGDRESQVKEFLRREGLAKCLSS